MKHKVKSFEELSNNKVGLSKINMVGVMGFFLIFTWITWIGFLLYLKFDPSTSFIWIFVSNIILIPLLIIIHNHYKIVRTEMDTIIKHLENQNEMIDQLFDIIRKRGLWITQDKK